MKLCTLTGNLLNRTLGLLKKNCQSTLVVDSSIAATGSTFKDTVEKLVKFLKAVQYISSNRVILLINYAAGADIDLQT